MKLKLLIYGILILAVIGVIFISGYVQQKPAEGGIQPVKVPKEEIQERIYTNKELGFKVQIPVGWKYKTELISKRFGGVVFAQEAELPNPGLTPDSPFYFLDTLGEKIVMFFTFGAEKKAERAFKIAEEKLAEVTAMAQKGKAEALEKASKKYEEYLGIAKEKGKDIERLVVLIAGKWNKSHKSW
ncbi:MAG: DUF5667 domain-containing protein [Methanocellales archaeon]|nr:DUF5667 domain-containing protein [Methanocellales archaeon]